MLLAARTDTAQMMMMKFSVLLYDDPGDHLFSCVSATNNPQPRLKNTVNCQLRISPKTVDGGIGTSVNSL